MSVFLLTSLELLQGSYVGSSSLSPEITTGSAEWDGVLKESTSEADSWISKIFAVEKYRIIALN